MSNASQLRVLEIKSLVFHDGVLPFWIRYLELVRSFVTPKEPKTFVIRKTRQIPFID